MKTATRKQVLADLRSFLSRAQARTNDGDPIRRAEAIGEAAAYRAAIDSITGERIREGRRVARIVALSESHGD